MISRRQRVAERLEEVRHVAGDSLNHLAEARVGVQHAYARSKGRCFPPGRVYVREGGDSTFSLGTRWRMWPRRVVVRRAKVLQYEPLLPG